MASVAVPASAAYSEQMYQGSWEKDIKLIESVASSNPTLPPVQSQVAFKFARLVRPCGVAWDTGILESHLTTT